MEDNERKDKSSYYEENSMNGDEDTDNHIETAQKIEERSLQEDDDKERGIYEHYEIEDQENPNKKMQECEKNKTHKKFSFKTFGLGVLLGALIISFLWEIGSNKSAHDETSEAEQIELNKADIAEDSNDLVSAGILDVSDVVEQCMPSIVSVTNSSVEEVLSWHGIMQQEVSSVGSGIIIGENETELLIITNYHVVSNADSISISFSVDDSENNAVAAQMKGYDSQKDLAVLSVKLSDISDEIKNEIVIATIGNSDDLKVGEQVVAIGNALGYGQSVTTGIVSAKEREVTVENSDGSSATNKLIQTDAAINPGNSGGALLNMSGEVIGINSVKFASEEVEGMGYAIPISDVESIINDLMNKETKEKVSDEEKGKIGISCIDVTDEVAEAYGMPKGVYISSIEEGSPAEEAGLQKGYIITKFAGNSIANYEELQNELSYYKSGERVDVVVQCLEGGVYIEKTFTIELA